MDERLKQQQRRQRLERTRRVGKAGLWQTSKKTRDREALSGDGSVPEKSISGSILKELEVKKKGSETGRTRGGCGVL